MNKADAINDKRNSQRVVNRKRRPDRRARNQGFVTSSSIHGHRIQIPSDPPCIVQNPWTNIVVHFIWRLGVDSQTGLINVADVTTKLKKQLDSSTTSKIFQNFNVYLRVHSVCCWNLTGKSVGLAVWDYSADSQDEDELGSWVDAGNSTGFPHIGYQWPISLRSNSLSNSDNNQNRRICTIVSGTREEVLVHIKVQYRFITPTTNPLLGLNSLSLIAARQAETIQAIRSNNKVISQDLNKIYDQMPGRTLTPTGMAANVFVGGFIPIATDTDGKCTHGRQSKLEEHLSDLRLDDCSDGFSVPDSNEFDKP